MSHDQGLQSWPATTFQRTTDRPVVPILIQVPALPALMGPSARSSLRVKARTSSSLRPQRRRRLRREVRVAAYAMMLMAPMMYAPLALWGERSSNTKPAESPGPERPMDGPELTSALHPPVISISIEPVVGAPSSEAEPPVVFPGYLLPDNDSEGTVHAGS
jgi:hypothetical protein